MKRILWAILLISFQLVLGQIPSGYYDTAISSGYDLKTELNTIITNGHIDQGYDQLYVAYQTTDSDFYFENNGNILDMYSENPSGNDPYNFDHISSDQCGNYSEESDCYNREHLFPQGFFDGQYPMRSDIHHVIPVDGYTNGRRSNFPFGNVTTPSWTSDNGSKLGSGSNYGYNGIVFEPIDEFKGDIARSLFYFAVRYENDWNTSGWDSPDATNNTLNGSSNQFYDSWYISLLLEWHQTDPVSTKELDRNNNSYLFQGNRNPFIDHPEFVLAIWEEFNDTTAPSPISNIEATAYTNSIDLNWTEATDNIGVTGYAVSIDGVFYSNTSTTSISITGLMETTEYCFSILAFDGFGNNSSSVSICESTLNTNSNTNELFFSEYIEGSGTNKALEIYNPLTSSIPLSSYSIKLSANGSGVWNTTYNFPSNSSIDTNNVYVIQNTGSTLCTNQTDNLNTPITSFNGNDVLGLFKNDILIDIIGELSNSSNFAQNVTLIRKDFITGPSTTYDASQWLSFSTNNCDDLGNHNPVLSVSDDSLDAISIFPNPTSNTFINIINAKNSTFEIYDLLGRKLMYEFIDTNKYILSLDTFKATMVLLKISNGKKISTHKILLK